VGLALTEDMNWCKFIDEMVPPYYQGDAEGWLSTLPAVASCLLGVFAGKRLQGPGKGERKVLWLAGMGALLTAAGMLWGLEFPVIKRLWTSSYVLVAGGLSFLLLGLFYWLVELRGRRSWAEPFVWVGLNPLAVYVGSDLLGFHGIAERLCAGLLQDPWGGALVAAVSLGLIFLAARFLHRRGIYLRV
jgi:predicted acyltransferase